MNIFFTHTFPKKYRVQAVKNTHHSPTKIVFFASPMYLSAFIAQVGKILPVNSRTYF